MEPAEPEGEPSAAAPLLAMPNDVLIVEDDAIIAIDFEEAIRSFGVPTVRPASGVAEALKLIEDQTPGGAP